MSEPRMIYYQHAAACEYETIHGGIYEAVKRHYRVGETAFETAHRLLINEALERSHGHQGGAAEMLRVSKRSMNYYCAGLQLRPKDRGTL